MERYNSRYDMRRQGCSGRQMNGYTMPARSYSRDRDCGCAGSNPNPPEMIAPFPMERENIDQFPVTMAYVPWQRWNDTYDLCRGLSAGTIFPELDKPFLCSRCVK